MFVLIISLICFWSCQSGHSPVQQNENTPLVTVLHHTEIAARSVIRGEIATNPVVGTVYTCPCGNWHTANGGESLYTGDRCQNLNNLQFSVSLKANSSAGFNENTTFILSDLYGSVSIINSAGNTQVITQNGSYTGSKIITGGNSIVLIRSSKEIIFSDEEKVELGEM
ncbi:MAG: hypothetical protein H8E85_03075 [Candidatus Marinimicrobia bacterium]|nr:hypothetical protein [Candidatus Neomarinimicrobiota bacterium]